MRWRRRFAHQRGPVSPKQVIPITTSINPAHFPAPPLRAADNGKPAAVEWRIQEIGRGAGLSEGGSNGAPGRATQGRTETNVRTKGVCAIGKCTFVAEGRKKASRTSWRNPRPTNWRRRHGDEPRVPESRGIGADDGRLGEVAPVTSAEARNFEQREFRRRGTAMIKGYLQQRDNYQSQRLSSASAARS